MSRTIHRPPAPHVGFQWILLALGVMNASTVTAVEYEGAPIHYMTAEVADPIAKLAKKVAAGELTLEYDEKLGYLPAVLQALDVPVQSQTLVFSKTSLQLNRITPLRPRALYFSDDVYVGYCQRGDVLELAATDPKQGAIFYTLKQSVNEPVTFVRDRGQCLSCHSSGRTQNVPGYLVRSVFTDRRGQPILGSGTYTTDHTSPLKERWGGWYVTGQHGSMRHMGNRCFTEAETIAPDLEPGANHVNLTGLVSTEPYPSSHSDIVALMVLEHQSQMHNAIAAANYETRQALHQSYEMNDLLGREAGHVSESAQRRIDAVAEQVLEYLLFCGEFPLEDSISGTSGFAEHFAKRGVRDSQGRSLRDFDLQRRLFRYPCSYLIHSAAFDQLPEMVRAKIYQRLRQILEGDDGSDRFAHLDAESRLAIREILRETKPEFRQLLEAG